MAFTGGASIMDRLNGNGQPAGPVYGHQTSLDIGLEAVYKFLSAPAGRDNRVPRTTKSPLIAHRQV